MERERDRDRDRDRRRERPNLLRLLLSHLCWNSFDLDCLSSAIKRGRDNGVAVRIEDEEENINEWFSCSVGMNGIDTVII